MSNAKLTQVEAERLLQMTKRSLIAEINFPHSGETNEFDVIGDTNREKFAVNIFRSAINPFKYNIGARITRKGIMLLELHINLSGVHRNPDGNKITGSHWHIYSEEYGMTKAFPAEDIKNDEFVKNTLDFLIRFNVVDRPNINQQIELI